MQSYCLVHFDPQSERCEHQHCSQEAWMTMTFFAHVTMDFSRWGNISISLVLVSSGWSQGSPQFRNLKKEFSFLKDKQDLPKVPHSRAEIVWCSCTNGVTFRWELPQVKKSL